MATPLKLYFSNERELYNAVYFANAIGDTHPGSYEITLQATDSGRAPNASAKNLNQYDTNSNTQLDTNELQAVINDLTNPAQNEIFDGSIITTFGEIETSDGFRAAMFGIAPTIRHDLTINFELESTPGQSYHIPHQRFRTFDVNQRINAWDFWGGNPIAFAAGAGDSYRRGFYSTGLKINDFDPTRQINVTINGLKNSDSSFLIEQVFPPGGDPDQFPAVGVMIDNSENLIINDIYLGATTILGDKQKPTKPPAQIINRDSGNLTLTGDIIFGPALNYINSLAFNQGRLEIDNADIRVFDKNSPGNIFHNARFGNADRAIGAISNVGTLLISDSRLSQEADNKVGLGSLTNLEPFYNSVLGQDDAAGTNKTPGWTAPTPLEYLISNSGSASISNSIIAGILHQQGSSAASLSLQNSHLGYGETPTYENLIIDSGSYSVNSSTIDKISTAARPSQLSNSVILSSTQQNAVAASNDPAYSQFLDPSKPSLFTASKETVGLLQLNSTGEFWRTNYDPAQLNPAVLAAVNAALQGSQAANPTVTRIQLGFGTTLDASEKQQAQSITASTHDIPDGTPLTLQLNNKQYQAAVTGDQAAFTIPASDLAALPTGTASAVVNGLLNGNAIPSQQATFSVDGQAFAAVPHITAIVPSFGTVLEAS